MLLGLNPRPNWIWAPRCRTLAPPLIHARLSGRIKELTRHFCFESRTVRNFSKYGIPLKLFSKDKLFQSAKFSCHYYLTIHEPRRRACRLSLAFVGSFVNHAYLLLIKRIPVLFCFYKWFFSKHSFTFSLPTSWAYSMLIIHLSAYSPAQRPFLP